MSNGSTPFLPPTLAENDQNLWTGNDYGSFLLWNDKRSDNRWAFLSPREIKSRELWGNSKDAVDRNKALEFWGWCFIEFSIIFHSVNLVLSRARGHVDNVLKVFSTVQIKSTQIPEGWSLWHMDIRTDIDRYSPVRFLFWLFLKKHFNSKTSVSFQSPFWRTIKRYLFTI